MCVRVQCKCAHACVGEKGSVQGTSSALCEVMGELKCRRDEVRPLGSQLRCLLGVGANNV